MTLPRERTRAVIQTRNLLVRMASDPRGPWAQEAGALLRHYPNVSDMSQAGEDCPELFDLEAAWAAAGELR